MTPNNNLSVLPWYKSLDEQNARRWWIYNRIYPLFVPARCFIPFQIIRNHDTDTTIQSFVIYDRTGAMVGNYTNSISPYITIKQFTDYDVIVFNRDLSVFSSMDNGQYYAVLTDGAGNTWYSEMYTAVNDITPYIRLEWWDDEDMVMDSARIVYTQPTFKNVMWLGSNIAKPEYIFEEEGENRDGYFFPIKQISEKRYHFAFFAPEYLLDVMRFIRMADHARIIKDMQTYNLDTFLITPEWEDNGDVATVNAEFTTDTVAKKLSKGQQAGPVGPVDCRISVDATSGRITAISDYNVTSSLTVVINNANTSARIATITIPAGSSTGYADITPSTSLRTGIISVSPGSDSNYNYVLTSQYVDIPAERETNCIINVTAENNRISASTSARVASDVTLTIRDAVSAQPIGTITIGAGSNVGTISISPQQSERTGLITVSPTSDSTYNYVLASNTVVIPGAGEKPNNIITVTATKNSITAVCSNNVASEITVYVDDSTTMEPIGQIVIASGSNSGTASIIESGTQRTGHVSLSRISDDTYNYVLANSSINIPAGEKEQCTIVITATKNTVTAGCSNAVTSELSLIVVDNVTGTYIGEIIVPVGSTTGTANITASSSARVGRVSVEPTADANYDYVLLDDTVNIPAESATGDFNNDFNNDFFND